VSESKQLKKQRLEGVDILEKVLAEAASSIADDIDKQIMKEMHEDFMKRFTEGYTKRLKKSEDELRKDQKRYPSKG
jgi:hypothetical protein